MRCYLTLVIHAYYYHLLIIYIYNTGIKNSIIFILILEQICFVFHLGLEITKITEQLLQAIANSDYDMYK